MLTSTRRAFPEFVTDTRPVALPRARSTGPGLRTYTKRYHLARASEKPRFPAVTGQTISTTSAYGIVAPPPTHLFLIHNSKSALNRPEETGPLGPPPDNISPRLIGPVQQAVNR